MLLNRLHKAASGEIDLSQTQVQAINILLKKALPDLQAITLSGDEEGAPVKIQVGWLKE